MTHISKYICRAVFACAVFFMVFSTADLARGEDHAKEIEVVEADIKMNYQEVPAVAYLYLTLKNNGGLNISNMTLKIGYFGEGDYLIHKTIVKNALNNILPKGETRKYKIRLRGDFNNERNEQYPYSRSAEINDFDIKIINVKIAR
ncbi:MAG: hypothetical protein PHT32_07540 [Candidatus Omnitrophica bacterium]|nr:hypothetical protein [Candidatus Omnitrophota bacterium]